MEVADMADLKYLTVPHLDRKALARIFSNIDIDRVAGCWNWRAGTNGHGYGRTRYNGRTESVHRMMYAWLVAPLPRGLAKTIPQLDHIICNNRCCANPAHVSLVPPRINILRGASPPAEFAKRIICKLGNPLTRYGKQRRCYICILAYQKTYKRKTRRANGIP